TQSLRTIAYLCLARSRRPWRLGLTVTVIVPAVWAVRWVRANAKRPGAGSSRLAVVAKLFFQAVSRTSITPGPGTWAWKLTIPLRLAWRWVIVIRLLGWPPPGLVAGLITV